jgi:hypothetical protein
MEEIKIKNQEKKEKKEINEKNEKEEEEIKVIKHKNIATSPYPSYVSDLPFKLLVEYLHR